MPLAGGYDRLQEMVADLVQRQVAVIAIPNTTGSALAERPRRQCRCLQHRKRSGRDGPRCNPHRPGKNVTGVAMLQTAVTAKRLELLHELASTDRSILLVTRATLVLPGRCERGAAGGAYAVSRRNRTRVVFSFGADAPCAAESWVERGESAAGCLAERPRSQESIYEGAVLQRPD